MEPEERQKIPDEVIAWVRQHPSLVHWGRICNFDLPEDFIQDFVERLPVVDLSQQNLSLGLIRKFKYRLDWNTISGSHELTDELVEEFGSRLNWVIICCNRELSEQFIRQHANWVIWKHIFECQTHIPKEILQKIYDDFHIVAEMHSV